MKIVILEDSHILNHKLQQFRNKAKRSFLFRNNLKFVPKQSICRVYVHVCEAIYYIPAVVYACVKCALQHSFDSFLLRCSFDSLHVVHGKYIKPGSANKNVSYGTLCVLEKK